MTSFPFIKQVCKKQRRGLFALTFHLFLPHRTSLHLELLHVFLEVQLHQLMILLLSWHYRLLRTSPGPQFEGPSSEDSVSVWSLPHTHPLLNHGLYLCLPVFPVRPILWKCLLGHPGVCSTVSGTNGEDDKIEDFPGISAFLPQNLQLHSLQSPLGQS